MSRHFSKNSKNEKISLSLLCCLLAGGFFGAPLFLKKKGLWVLFRVIHAFFTLNRAYVKNRFFRATSSLFSSLSNSSLCILSSKRIYICTSNCLKVVLKLSVPEYILTLKKMGTPLVLVLVRRGYSTAKP